MKPSRLEPLFPTTLSSSRVYLAMFEGEIDGSVGLARH